MAKRVFLILMCLLLTLSPLALAGCDNASEQFQSFKEQIKGIEKISGKNGVDTYEITFQDGSYSKIKIENSDPELSVKSAEIDDAGNLILIMSDNTTKNLGSVLGDKGDKGDKGEKGDKGDKGDKGATGVGIDELVIENGELIVSYTNGITENLGPIEEQEVDNWEYLYYIWCLTYPDYEYSQLEWMAQIVSNALEIEVYTVTFDSNGGSDVEEQLVERGDKVALPEKPTNQGYVFDGWYVGDEKWSFIGYTVTEDITLKAKWISKDSIPESERWNGETLNVLVTPYASGSSPFAQMELNPSYFGEDVKKAYDERQVMILQNYGVTVNWVSSSATHSVWNDIVVAETSDTVTYEIAMPRAYELQNLVSKVYDISSSEYIDLSASYYNQASAEAFTVAERTLFVGGDFGFSDELVSFVLYYNKDMLAEVDESIDLYTEVKNGTWTYDKFLNLAKQVHEDLPDANNVTGTQGDEDVYGFSTSDVSRFYHYAGLKEADVDDSTGLYRVTLNSDMDKLNSVIANIIEVNNGTTWAHTKWNGSWGSNAYDAFYAGRVLFYDQSVSDLITKDYLTNTFNVGIVPFPKYDAQSSYYSFVTKEQTTFICIPKVTRDREISEFFVNLLCETGNEYVMEPFKQMLDEKMNSEVAEENIEILENYVFPNVIYDAGYLSSGWSSLLTDVKKSAYETGSNTFSSVYLDAEQDVISTINLWNSAWESYTE